MEWGELLPVALVVLGILSGWMFIMHGRMSKMEGEIEHLKEGVKNHVDDVAKISRIEGVIDMTLKENETNVFEARGKLLRDKDTLFIRLLGDTGGEALDIKSNPTNTR